MASNATDSNPPASHGDAEDLTPREAELLEEYERLADNMKKVFACASLLLYSSAYVTRSSVE